jgi:hypothetical protein
MLVLDEHTAGVVRSLCELIVPRSGRVGPEVYIDALLARMPEEPRAHALAAIEALEQPAAAGAEGLAKAPVHCRVHADPRARVRGLLQRLRRAGGAGTGRLDDHGAPLPETRGVLEMIARHGMVLATGHLSRDEILAVVDAALEHGVREIVITHPEFPSQNLTAQDQRALADRGALLERCFTTPHTGKVPWERWLENIRAAGAEHSVLSTDLGQVFNPPVEDGMALMVDRLLEAGFDDQEVHTMAVLNSRRVAGAEPL